MVCTCDHYGRSFLPSLKKDNIYMKMALHLTVITVIFMFQQEPAML